MKIVRVYASHNGESALEQRPVDLESREGARTALENAESICFLNRVEGSIVSFHPASSRQYIFYLTARVEIGAGDGSSVVMDPGDVLLTEDTTGAGHRARVLQAGVCAIVALR